jgi:hypothetical protein
VSNHAELLNEEVSWNLGPGRRNVERQEWNA